MSSRAGALAVHRFAERRPFVANNRVDLPCPHAHSHQSGGTRVNPEPVEDKVLLLPDKRVIAYFMHESERTDASTMLKNVQVTDSYAIGDIDDARIVDLERKGLIVQPLHPPAADPTPTAALARSVELRGIRASPRAAIDASLRLCHCRRLYATRNLSFSSLADPRSDRRCSRCRRRA